MGRECSRSLPTMWARPSGRPTRWAIPRRVGRAPDLVIALLPSVEHVRPLLHHLGAVGEVLDMLAGAPHGVGFDVRHLTLDPVGRVAHFVEPRAARGARGMGAVLSAPAQHVQTLNGNCAGNSAPLLKMSLLQCILYPLSYPISNRRSASRTTSLAGVYGPDTCTDQALSNRAPLAYYANSHQSSRDSHADP